MPGITFNIKGEKKTILFDQTIHSYLRKREGDNGEFEILNDLDPYGYCEFTSSQIQSLILLCDKLIEKYNDEFNWEHGRVRKFCKKFKELCVEAIEKKMNIEGSGD
ncbi:hypothetical protein [Fictibacillus sp. 18YEL24]|uniref:hypothetical protein n=1 Tax=Fictibacillus sp. 18YEL24 TaxID=2745875 RepID=UPI0018CD955E|nr:hypothetical protein [Fictibacillus sp. 18YEL24]MBH0169131.1 hypothetical protein [Fictibacillus sp. 18YEL24]